MPVPSTDGAPAPSLASLIAIAGFKKVYSTSRIEAALDELPANANEALRSVYEKMLRTGGERFCVKPGAMPDFDTMEQELPNFGAVLDDLRKQLALCLETQDPLELSPMLLLGDPGISTSFTWSGCTPACSKAPLMAMAPRWVAEIPASTPPKLPMGVRTAEIIYTSFMVKMVKLG